MYFVAKPNEEAKAFIQAAGLTDETQMKAIGTLVFDLKNYGLWDKMRALYPFVTDQRNLLNNTNTLSSWSGVNSSGYSDPEGGNTAFKVIYALWALQYFTKSSTTYTQTVWVKSVSGADVTFTLGNGNGPTGAVTKTATATWQRVSNTTSAFSSGGSFYIYNLSDPTGIYVWHPQMEISSTATAYQPTTDVQTTIGNQFKYNLKDPRDLDAAFRLSFTSNWIFSKTGATPNGTSDYANTFLNSNTLEFTSNHMSIYGGTSNTARIHYNMGAKDYFYMEIGSYAGGNNLGPITFKSGLTNNSGFFLSSRSVLSTTKLFQNNTVLNTSTSTNQATRDSLVIFGARSDGNPTSLAPLNYADGEVRFITIGNGLTDTDAANLYTAVQRFQTTLGRQV